MDQVVQGELKKAAEAYGKENVIVVLGSPDADSADIYAETVTVGDPTFAGPLAGVSLELEVYHILEDEIKAQIPSDIYQDQVGLAELSLDRDQICNAMQNARVQFSINQ
jgi:glycine reductase